MRLSLIISDRFQISRRYAKSEISSGKVKIDGSIVTRDLEVEAAQSNLLNIDYLSIKQELKFDKNEFLLADYNDIKFIYKRSFTHSDRLRPIDPLTVSDIVMRFGDYIALSRLDYEVDGVVAIIKPGTKIKRIKKYYLAIVEGEFPDTPINLSYSINADDRKRVKVNNDYTGHLTYIKRVDTRYDDKKNGYSLISIELEKATRHQIRAFCSKIGFPIIGDSLYGGKDYAKLMLHCNRYDINDYSSTSQTYEQVFKNIFYNILNI